MTEITICAICESKDLKKKKGSFAVEFKGKKMKIPGVEYYICGNCGEKFTDLENESRIDAYLKSKGKGVA